MRLQLKKSKPNPEGMSRLRRIGAFFAGLLLFTLLAVGAFAAEGRYRDQLEGVEKQIYDSLLENLENREESFTCTFEPAVRYEDEKQAQTQMQSATFRAYEAFYRDHPEIFWVSKNGGISVSPQMAVLADGCTLTSIQLTTKFNDSGSIGQKQQQLEAAVSSLLAQATGSDYERLCFIHDALTENCAYDMQAKSSPAQNPDAYEAYGALVNGSAVCEGYSKAMKLLCDRMGIPCVLVGGNAGGEAHMWNYVQLDGAYYLLDATFDDPVGGSPTRDYFLKGSATVSDHKPGGGFLQGFNSNFTDPSLSEQDYQPGASSSSSGGTGDSSVQPRSCRVRYSASHGGSYEVSFGGSIGPVDNGQLIESGTIVSVRALPKDGYELEEIRVEMGDREITEKQRSEIYFKVTEDCKITVSFRIR